MMAENVSLGFLPTPDLGPTNGWRLDEEPANVPWPMRGNNLRNVILATTMWEKIDDAEGAAREEQLIGTFWKPMIDNGSIVRRVLLIRRCQTPS